MRFVLIGRIKILNAITSAHWIYDFSKIIYIDENSFGFVDHRKIIFVSDATTDASAYFNFVNKMS